MRFVFPHSHAFRSGRLLIDDDEKPGPACTVEFGDGVNVIAEWHSDADAIRLDVPDYRTASGTLVAARSWRLAQDADGVWRSTLLP